MTFWAHVREIWIGRPKKCRMMLRLELGFQRGREKQDGECFTAASVEGCEIFRIFSKRQLFFGRELCWRLTWYQPAAVIWLISSLE